jgi:O-methyltransferase involved in polyketide biosynthesis
MYEIQPFNLLAAIGRRPGAPLHGRCGAWHRRREAHKDRPDYTNDTLERLAARIDGDHPALNRMIPNAACIHNLLLGGKDHGRADRDVVERLLRCDPEIERVARRGRRFALDAVRAAAESGFGLFVDLGCGYPARDSVHEAARPGALVLYVDHDPVVAVHARALLAVGDGVQVMEADVRTHLGRVLDHRHIRASVRAGEPVVVVMTGLGEYLTDGELAAALDTLAGTLPSGSLLIFSHGVTGGSHPEAIEKTAEVYGEAGIPMAFRSSEQLRALFDDRWSEQGPGLAPVAEWEPDRHDSVAFDDPATYVRVARLRDPGTAS